MVPMIMISQWRDEIESFSRLKMCIYYGNDRQSLLSEVNNFDIVITSYGTLASEMERTGRSLFSFVWNRVVLDEAHTIRNTGTGKRFFSSFPIVLQLSPSFSSISCFQGLIRLLSL